MGEAVTEERIAERADLRQAIRQMRILTEEEKIAALQVVAILNLADTVEALIKADDLDKRIRKLEEAVQG